MISHDPLARARTRRRRFPGLGTAHLPLSEAVRRPPEKVWESLVSDESLAAWGPMIKDVTWTSPRPFGVGTTREVTAPGGSVMRERFFQWDDGNSKSFYVYESALPLFKRFAEHYLVEPAGSETLFTWTLAIEPKSAFALPVKVLAPILKAGFGGFRRAARSTSRRAAEAGMSALADQTRWMDATDQAALVASGEVSPGELLEAAIERIERIDQTLNAVVIRWFDHAREIAASPDLPNGPFRGVPFLIKDLFADYAGQRISNGNVALKEAHFIADADTTLVSRYRAAGLVIAGRTNSPELGSVPTTEPVAWGATHNPWDTTRTPGGSSGGAAAAVASGMVPFAHASDGGGSIRIPASCCGLVGLKPSQGRITLGPIRDESGLAVEHCVSRTVGTRPHCSTRRAARASATP